MSWQLAPTIIHDLTLIYNLHSIFQQFCVNNKINSSLKTYISKQNKQNNPSNLLLNSISISLSTHKTRLNIMLDLFAKWTTSLIPPPPILIADQPSPRNINSATPLWDEAQFKWFKWFGTTAWQRPSWGPTTTSQSNIILVAKAW